MISKPPNKIAKNPPIRPKEGAKLRAQDIKRLKLVRPIIPKTDPATIEIHPKIEIAVGYFDSVAYIISATPKMILTTTAKICRPNDSDPGFILQDIKGMIVFMEKLTPYLFVGNGEK